MGDVAEESEVERGLPTPLPHAPPPSALRLRPGPLWSLLIPELPSARRGLHHGDFSKQ